MDISRIPCICFHARRAARSITQTFCKHLRSSGLNACQYGMLSCLSLLENQSISDIGRLMNMEQSTVTRNIEALQKKGLVRTAEHPDDPRKKRVFLTEEGKSLLASGQKAWQEAQNEIKAKLGEADFETLIRLLSKIS